MSDSGPAHSGLVVEAAVDPRRRFDPHGLDRGPGDGRMRSRVLDQSASSTQTGAWSESPAFGSIQARVMRGASSGVART